MFGRNCSSALQDVKALSSSSYQKEVKTILSRSVWIFHMAYKKRWEVTCYAAFPDMWWQWVPWIQPPLTWWLREPWMAPQQASFGTRLPAWVTDLDLCLPECCWREWPCGFIEVIKTHDRLSFAIANNWQLIPDNGHTPVKSGWRTIRELRHGEGTSQTFHGSSRQNVARWKVGTTTFLSWSPADPAFNFPKLGRALKPWVENIYARTCQRNRPTFIAELYKWFRSHKGNTWNMTAEMSVW